MGGWAFAVAAVLAFALGTVIGSFLNVCIWRLPREESVVRPPSHCPECDHRLAPLDLVPLFSFLCLGRRCRYCGAAISWRYFTVELITGLLFVGLWLSQGPALVAHGGAGDLYRLFAYLGFTAVLVAAFFTDLDHMIIPDELVIAGLALGLSEDLVGYLTGSHGLWQGQVPFTQFVLMLPRSVVGAVVGAGFFVGLELFSQAVFRREGMGGGDMKLGAAIGSLLGPGLALLSFGLSVFLGAVVGGLLLATRLKGRKDYIPFGPFIVVCTLAVLFAPEWAGQTAVAGWKAYLASFHG